MEEKGENNLVLKRVRQERGKSLRDLAKELKVHWSTVSYWERGIKTPRERNKIKLANIFNMSSEDLLKEDK